MRGLVSRFIIALCALAVPAAAFGQMTGTRIGKNAKEEDLPQVMFNMSKCVVDRRPDAARNWLATLPGSAEEDRRFKSEIGDLSNCLDHDQLVLGDVEITVTSRIVRRPLAVALARRELKRSAAPPAVPADALAWFTPQLAAVPADSVDMTSLVIQDFGHCVALSSWAGARALVLAENGSAEEEAAVKMLLPHLSPCVAKDLKMKVTPDNLRTALAEPMLHILAGESIARAAAEGRD